MTAVRGNILRTLCVFVLVLLCSATYAARRDRDTTYHKKPFISSFRDIYFLGGFPVNDGWNNDTFDFKFQLSLKTHPIRLSDTWAFFFEYTQLSVWNFFGESSPFKKLRHFHFLLLFFITFLRMSSSRPEL